MSDNTPEIVIRAGKTARHYWRDLWIYRELLWFLTWRDVLVRYKQTVIGIAWALLRPFLTLLVFTVVFSIVVRLPTVGSVPYAIMVFAGLLPWLFFANTLSEASSSLIDNERLITKIYFPRILVPLSTVLVTLLDFLISGALLIGLFFWFDFFPDKRAAFLPFFLLLACGAALDVQQTQYLSPSQ